MATPQQLEAVSSWLKRVLVPYVQSSLVHNQTLALLSVTNSLAPRTEHFTYDDGRTQLLLTLKGTIPIKFKGGSYNIPLAIWVPFNYPTEECLVYVVPTSNMLIRPSSKVELSGRVHMQQLGQHDLRDAVEALKTLFEREPPVYAKPQGVNRSTARPPSYGSPSPTLPSRPEQSTSTTPSTSRPPSSHSATSSRPPLPAPPPIPPASPVSPPPPRPPLPARPDALQVSPSPPAAATFSPSGTPPLPPAPSGSSTSNGANMNRPPFAPTALSRSQPINNILDEPEELSRDSSPRPQLSQSEPPRPVHPEVLALRSALLAKLQQADAEQHQRHAESLRNFDAIHQDLQAGQDAIRDELGRLGAVHQIVMNVRDRYEETVEASQRRLNELEEREDPDVDQVVACPSPIHTQLLNLLSSDAALEDTIYQLGRSLHSGEDERVVAVDMEKTLKRIRNLAREQFFDRALANKVLLELAVASVNS